MVDSPMCASWPEGELTKAMSRRSVRLLTALRRPCTQLWKRPVRNVASGVRLRSESVQPLDDCSPGRPAWLRRKAKLPAL